MALTSKFQRDGWFLTHINGRKAPAHLNGLRIPPAWTDVKVDPTPGVHLVATGVDAAGRTQRLYSPEWVARAKSDKFERVKGLLTEWDDIRTQIESDLNAPTIQGKDREAALVAYLIYETGMRPGSNRDTLASVKAYGATTVQMRHVTPSAKGARLKFVGKKGVGQNVLVTNPYIAEELVQRKRNALYRTTKPVFRVSSSKVNQYVAGLGSGEYTVKDFRTARGTKLALELLGNRKRLPRTKSGRRKVVNDALDRVARMLGNTRAISRKSYVDPGILERFVL
jgi:DNA topoisomerase-1